MAIKVMKSMCIIFKIRGCLGGGFCQGSMVQGEKNKALENISKTVAIVEQRISISWTGKK